MTERVGTTREELYRLVWSKPMTKIGAEFGVSGSYLARVCTLLNVPRPERGYWAKLEVGKAPRKPPLPDARPGDPLEWSPDGAFMPRAAPQPLSPPRKRIRVPVAKDHVHALVRGARGHFESGRPVEEGAYLRPYKRLLLDLNASATCLGRALDFANALFNALESAGHRVSSAASNRDLRHVPVDEREKPSTKRDPYHYGRLWSPQHPTVVYIGTVAIGLAIMEMSENVRVRHQNGKYVRESEVAPPPRRRIEEYSFTTDREMPSGRLRLIAYCPYARVMWMTQWQESGTATLSSKVAGIVREIENAVPHLIEQLEEAARQAEIEHQKWLAEREKYHRADDRKRVEQSVCESREQLEEVIRRWSAVVGIEQFFAGLEARSATLSGDERRVVEERLALARTFVGSQDPLDFFRAWRSPEERYVSKYSDTADHSDALPGAVSRR